MTTGNNTQTLRVVIEAVDRASQTIKGIADHLQKSLQDFGRRMLIMGGAVTGFAAIAVHAAEAQVTANALLANTIDSLGGSYDAVAAHVQAVIAEQDKLSKFNATELTNALNIGATGLRNLDAALRALPAAVALASGTGKSLEEAMSLIVNAINGDPGARSALFALGINLLGVANWTELLTEILKRYGAATEAANTPSAKLGDELHRLNVLIGEQLLPALLPVVQVISDIVTAINAWAAAHPTLFMWIVSITVALAALAVVVGTVSLIVAGLVAVFNPVVAAIVATIAVLVALMLVFGKLQDWLDTGCRKSAPAATAYIFS